MTGVPKPETRPREVKIQYPRPVGVADRLTTDSPGPRVDRIRFPEWRAHPKAATVPRPSTIQ